MNRHAINCGFTPAGPGPRLDIFHALFEDPRIHIIEIDDGPGGSGRTIRHYIDGAYVDWQPSIGPWPRTLVQAGGWDAIADLDKAP